MTMNGVKRIAVIGASSAGLTAAKELQEAGPCELVIFEKSDNTGGIFSSALKGSKKQLFATGSHTMHQFGYYPKGKEKSPKYTPLADHVTYLASLCDDYSLRQYIKFSTSVTRIRETTKTEPRSIAINYHCICSDGGNEIDFFDHVVLACGTLNAQQRPPNPLRDIPGFEGFTGEVVSPLDGLERLEQVLDKMGQRVFMLGAAEWGSDILLHAAAKAEATMVYTRQPQFYIPRYDATNMAVDLDTSWVHHAIPPSVWESKLGRLVRTIKLGIEGWAVRKDTRAAEIAQPLAWLNSHVKYHVFRRNGVKCEGVPLAMARYGTKVKIGPDCKIKRFDTNRLFFTDGESFDCDVIILATGFGSFGLPFMKASDFKSYCGPSADSEEWIGENPSFLFKRVIQPELGDKIGAIGLIRPNYGAYPPIIEMQSRFYAGVVFGRLTLPPYAQMKQSVQQAKAIENNHFHQSVSRMRKVLVHTASYLDDMSRLVGCKAPMWKLLFTDPRLWWHMLNGQICGLRYRTFGSGALPGARERYLTIPLAYRPARLVTLGLYSALCCTPKVFHNVMFGVGCDVLM